jgi:hypothetical protein
MEEKFGYIDVEELLGPEEMKAIKKHAERVYDEWEIFHLVRGYRV